MVRSNTERLHIVLAAHRTIAPPPACAAKLARLAILASLTQNHAGRSLRLCVWLDNHLDCKCCLHCVFNLAVGSPSDDARPRGS